MSPSHQLSLFPDDAPKPNLKGFVSQMPFPVRIGCCGWSYKDWYGQLYEAGTKPGKYLEVYSQHFSVVEVDSSFYGTPTAATVRKWRKNTPDQFQFTLKMPQVITHEKMMVDCGADLDLFQDTVQELGPKLLCICMQFGYINPKQWFDLPEFTERLNRLLEEWNPDIPLVVEVRNRDWITTGLLHLLKRFNVGLVLSFLDTMPNPIHLSEKFDILSGPLAYVRFLGDRKGIEKITTSWNKTVVDQSHELNSAAPWIVELARKVPVVAFVNNHYAGYAPETIEQLENYLNSHVPSDG